MAASIAQVRAPVSAGRPAPQCHGMAVIGDPGAALRQRDEVRGTARLNPVMSQVKDRKTKWDREKGRLEAFRQDMAQQESRLPEFEQDITELSDDQRVLLEELQSAPPTPAAEAEEAGDAGEQPMGGGRPSSTFSRPSCGPRFAPTPTRTAASTPTSTSATRDFTTFSGTPGHSRPRGATTAQPTTANYQRRPMNRVGSSYPAATPNATASTHTLHHHPQPSPPAPPGRSTPDAVPPRRLWP